MGRIFHILFLNCILFFSAGILKAQTHKLDSLKNKLVASVSYAEKKEIVLDICERFNSYPVDTFFKYLNIGFNLFPRDSREYLRLRNFYSTCLLRLGKIKEGLELSDSLLPYVMNGKSIDNTGVEILSNRSGGLIRDGKNKEAIELCFNLLRQVEPIKDTMGMIKAYTLLGWANMELEQYREAIRWLNKAVVFSGTKQMADKGSVVYANIASCYNNIGKADSASYFIELALKYSILNENLSTLANSLNIRADMFINKKDYTSAEKDMKAALEVRQKIGDPLYVISDMAQLSSFYASIGQTDKGITIANEGLKLARKQTNNITKLIFLYSALGENYQRAGRTIEYSHSLEEVIKLKDSLNSNDTRGAVAEMEAKYELQKKENIIIKQKYDLTQSRYLSIGASVLFVFGLLLIGVLYRNYRLVQHRKMETAMAEQKLLSYKAVEIAEENERKRIAADLHDNLGSYAAAITTNVKNLKEGLDNGTDLVITQLDENAQSMVTQLSDTIWVLKNEQLPITKLADRFKVWVQRLIQNYPNIKYHYEEHIVDDIAFSPSKILHIFLILKECVNNALKHSDCTDLKIKFFSEGNWMISVEDNGKGIESHTLNSGDGIDNIRRRAEECGWNVEWLALEPGTRVIISATNTK